MLLKLRWFSPNPISCTIGGTNKTYPNDIAEILLKLALNTIKQTKNKTGIYLFNSPCQRQCELLPSLGLRRPSSVVGRPLT
jgi:uncharacterized membrane protein